MSQPTRVFKFLKSEPNKKFTAREIAAKIIDSYQQDYDAKKSRAGFTDKEQLIKQVAAEIGSQKDNLKKKGSIRWRDKPSPRVYWYDTQNIDGLEVIEDDDLPNIDDDLEVTEDDDLPTLLTSYPISEQDLYPILIEYLKSELNLLCQRIDEKRSKNSHGKGGNHWLHPDIVAMQPIDKEWHDLIRSCVKQGAGQSVRLWSFEVKKELNSSNVRQSFFQAVSNSTWANEGYLVAASICNNSVEKELRMLSALHGIGVIVLNPENPSESEIMLPAKARNQVDWESVNRILVENKDFKDYIELVSSYYQTGRFRPCDWNKIIKN